MRAKPNSAALVQNGAWKRSHSQPDRPTWSGWQCVANTRFRGLPSIGPAMSCSQAARVASVLAPQSTSA
jgi:hypothetical protein